jgi:hypothetical protein
MYMYVAIEKGYSLLYDLLVIIIVILVFRCSPSEWFCDSVS